MKHIGKDVPFTVGGVAYTLSRFTRGILLDFQEWVLARIPHPLDELKGRLEGLPLELQRELVNGAIKEARTRDNLSSKDMGDWFASEKGAVKIFHLLLLKHHPAMTEEAAMELLFDLHDEHGLHYLPRLITEAQGELYKMPSSDDEEKKG